MINCNPIVDGKYERKDVTVEFSDDFSEIWICQGGQRVKVEGNFFRDCLNVMERAQSESESKDMLWNMIGTSLSLPTAKWEDL